jgi:RNA polymerase sigma-70 factor, ECF subfamily
LYYRGRSVAEAAKELGVPPGTVKSRSYYALRALRAVMAGTEAEVAR